MKKLMGVAAVLWAGLLVVPGNLSLVSRVYAQSPPAQSEEQKKHEEWQRERENLPENVHERRQKAEKRRLDAEKRQREAERQLQQQQPGGKTK